MCRTLESKEKSIAIAAALITVLSLALTGCGQTADDQDVHDIDQTARSKAKTPMPLIYSQGNNVFALKEK